VNRFGQFVPYKNQVKTTVKGKVYSLPINLHTINQFFGKAMRPDEAKEFIKSRAVKSILEPKTFEEQALALIGAELYEAFFKGYTQKQWGCAATDLPASILSRLPIRFNYNDNYFSHKFQGIPAKGYTSLVESILSHENIAIKLRQKVCREDAKDYSHVFYTGPLDGWFNYELGRLGYRTLDFERFTFDGDYQGTAVMNYGEECVPYTRITEHKHFSPWENNPSSVLYREYSRSCGPDDIPYYPIRLVNEMKMLSEYSEKANSENNVSFLGRLGTYRYLDMDVTIREALDAARIYLDNVKNEMPIPSFFHKM
jgi:UDP-galactopyranose mutase